MLMRTLYNTSRLNTTNYKFALPGFRSCPVTARLNIAGQVGRDFCVLGVIGLERFLYEYCPFKQGSVI
jgi:hypothetical protein